MASSEPRRGEIWLVSLGAARPALIVSVDEINSGAEDELFVVVPLSSSRAPSALRPVVSPGESIDAESAAICRGMRAVTRMRLLRRLGAASPETLAAVEWSLAMILGLEPARYP
jgi:mRNA interferase MazF